MIKLNVSNMNKQQKLVQAIRNKDIDNIKMLLNDDDVEPSNLDMNFISYFSKNGNEKIVELLLKDKRVSPSHCNNYAVRYAAKNGHLNIVKLLLNDNRVNPSDCSNHAVSISHTNGHHEIVELLCQKIIVINTLEEDNKELYNILEKIFVKNKISEF